MTESLRQKKVNSLMKEELSHILQDMFQGQESGLISITRVDLTKDLKTAHVYLSFFNTRNVNDILKQLERRTGHLRKIVASRINLKYNPQLIFSQDPLIDYEEKLGKIIDRMHSNEKK